MLLAVSPVQGDMGARTNHRQRHLHRGRGFKPKSIYFVTNNGKRGQTREKYGNGCRHRFDSCNPGKPQTQDIQRTEQAVRPRWEEREGTALGRGVTLPSFSGEKLGGFLSVFYLCSVYALCVFVFRNCFFSTCDHFSAKLKETRVLDADQVADVRNQRASIFSPITLLKLARTSNARFGRSANTLG